MTLLLTLDMHKVFLLVFKIRLYLFTPQSYMGKKSNLGLIQVYSKQRY